MIKGMKNDSIFLNKIYRFITTALLALVLIGFVTEFLQGGWESVRWTAVVVLVLLGNVLRAWMKNSALGIKLHNVASIVAIVLAVANLVVLWF